MTIHAMIQHDDTENAFFPELVFGWGTGSQPVWGYRLLACTTGEAPVLLTGKMPVLPNGRDALTPKRARRPYSQTGEAPVLHQNLEM